MSPRAKRPIGPMAVESTSPNPKTKTKTVTYFRKSYHNADLKVKFAALVYYPDGDETPKCVTAFDSIFGFTLACEVRIKKCFPPLYRFTISLRIRRSRVLPTVRTKSTTFLLQLQTTRTRKPSRKGKSFASSSEKWSCKYQTA